MLIRQEEKKDFSEIYEMVTSSFKTAEHSDGNEQDLVVKIRENDEYIKELSLVAVIDNKIVGHIMFTKVKLGDRIELALAPLSIDPDHQRQGIGMALMNEGHKIAKDLGYEFSIVLGSDKYYPKVGYKQASEFGISAPFDVPSNYFMALNLKGLDTKINAIVEYGKSFS